jgi:phospholipid/cholesterol/gamma-HCH transport system ATP-binding protein
MIKFENVEKYFGDNHVLRGLDLEISKRETLVIIGQSGCGKSVLLKHIMGLLKPEQGKVIVDGVDITHVTQKELYGIRRKFGMVFQSSALFDSMTVGENVVLGLRERREVSSKEMEEICEDKLGLVGLSGASHLKPAELSGGMKKRAAIARALAMNPEYILYDEPTTGLDPIIADRINELILDLQKGLHKTTIAVTHDMHSANKIADRIAMLHEGKVIFQGTPDEIRKTDHPVLKQFINGNADGPIISFCGAIAPQKLQ